MVGKTKIRKDLFECKKRLIEIVDEYLRTSEDHYRGTVDQI